jgi:aromatic-L-amino-acid decarboxylase
VIQGTASEAVLVVMLAARKRAVEKITKDQRISEFEALGRLVVYTSDQAHSCVNKASQVSCLYYCFVLFNFFLWILLTVL